MKLKKALAALTASVFAASVMAFTPMTVGATEYAPISTITGKKDDYAFSPNFAASADDPSAITKVVVNVTQTNGNWGWANGQIYLNGGGEGVNGAAHLVRFSDSRAGGASAPGATVGDVLLPEGEPTDITLSVTEITGFDFSQWHALAIQTFDENAEIDINSIKSYAGSTLVAEVYGEALGDPVTPTEDVVLGTQNVSGTSTITQAEWGLNGNTWNVDFLSYIKDAMKTANYKDVGTYVNEFAGILYEVNVSSISGAAKYGDLATIPYAQHTSYSGWISGSSVNIINGTTTYSAFIESTELPTDTAYDGIGTQILDSANFNTVGQSSTIEATVKATLCLTAPSPDVPAESITLNKTSLKLQAGDTSTLTATVAPADTTDTLTWSSSKTSVATVDENGKVTAVAVGTATITATAGDVSDTCTVTVTAADVAATGITVTPTKAALFLVEGKTTRQLTATVAPADATDYTVTYSSGNPAVATVSSDGLITAVSEGSCDITAAVVCNVSHERYTAKCSVTVASEYVPAKYVDYSYDTATYETTTEKAADTAAFKAAVDEFVKSTAFTLIADDEDRNIEALIGECSYSYDFPSVTPDVETSFTVTVNVLGLIDSNDIWDIGHVDLGVSTLGADDATIDIDLSILITSPEEDEDDDDDDDEDENEDDDEDVDDDDDDDSDDDVTEDDNNNNSNGGSRRNESNDVNPYKGNPSATPAGDHDSESAIQVDDNHIGSAISSAASGDTIIVKSRKMKMKKSDLRALAQKDDVIVKLCDDGSGYSVSVNSDDIDPEGSFIDLDFSVKGKFLTKDELADFEDKGAVDIRQLDFKHDGDFGAVEQVTVEVTFRGSSKGLPASALYRKGADSYSSVGSGTVGTDRKFSFTLKHCSQYVVYSYDAAYEAENISAGAPVSAEGTAAETAGPAAVAAVMLISAAVMICSRKRA